MAVISLKTGNDWSLIRAWREHLNISTADMAARLGWTLHLYRTGTAAAAPPDHPGRVSAALGYRPNSSTTRVFWRTHALMSAGGSWFRRRSRKWPAHEGMENARNSKKIADVLATAPDGAYRIEALRLGPRRLLGHGHLALRPPDALRLPHQLRREGRLAGRTNLPAAQERHLADRRRPTTRLTPVLLGSETRHHEVHESGELGQRLPSSDRATRSARRRNEAAISASACPRAHHRPAAARAAARCRIPPAPPAAAPDHCWTRNGRWDSPSRRHRHCPGASRCDGSSTKIQH